MRFRQLFFCLLIIVCGSLPAALGDEHTFELTWQTEGAHRNLHAAMDRTEPFEKEPDTDNRDVHRGVLHCGDLSNDETADVGFLWDKSKGKLYVDLNRDGNLTNDPEGVLTGEGGRSGDYINQNFSNFRFTMTTDAGEHHYKLSADLTSYSSWKNVNFTIHSNYEGAVELNGKKWSFRVVDSLRGKVGPGDSLSVWPVTGTATNRIDSQRMLETLFLHDRCYGIEFEFKPGDDNKPRLWCTLTEKDVPLEKLKLDGKGICQLVLDGNVRLKNPEGETIAGVQILVLPKLSDEVLSIPAGEFRCKQLALKPGDQRPPVTPQNLHNINVSVIADAENVLKVGAPLNHQVKIERTGKVLEFSYELVGAGGETYDIRAMTGYGGDNNPTVTIYKGDMKLASGQFEYG